MGSKISVVVPMYNSRDTIVPCVQSVIDQTYTDLITIVVINDGSKDDSLAVLKAAFNKLPERGAEQTPSPAYILVNSPIRQD